MDFTIKKYTELLKIIADSKYDCQTFHNYIKAPSQRSIILRHDVDLKPENSLLFARMLSKFGIQGTFYFRAKPCSWQPFIVEEIHSLGHEIGYHYENLSFCRGNYEKAIVNFEKNLIKFRNIVPISTICMHGSPLSSYDSKSLWDRFDYKQFDLIAEPYFDIDFNIVLYLTDTGRKWNGNKFNIRDNVTSAYNYSIRKTDDIISAFRENQLPNQIMFNFHPQRWTDNRIQWTKELISQSIKNQVKRIVKKNIR